MPTFKQGETFEEVSPVETSTNTTSSTDRTKKVAIIAAVGIVIVALLGTLIYMSAGKTTDDTKPESELTEGDFVYDSEGNIVLIDEISETVFTYTTAERDELRAWGYTAEDIEEGIANETPAQELIDKVKSAQEAIRAELNNPYSEAYQKLLHNTWLGGAPLTVPAADTVETNMVFKENVDYVKIEPRGNQLFLKLTLEDERVLFMTVTPSRWETLKDEGNIVIEYTEQQYPGAKIITDIQEVTY